MVLTFCLGSVKLMQSEVCICLMHKMRVPKMTVPYCWGRCLASCRPALKIESAWFLSANTCQKVTTRFFVCLGILRYDSTFMRASSFWSSNKLPSWLVLHNKEAKHEAFIVYYVAPVTRRGDDERVVFSDAVHPIDQIGPAHNGFVKGQKTAFRAGSRNG